MSNKLKVMIGVPMHSGQVSAQTLHSVTTGSSNIHVVNFKLLGLSLLAKNFNLLFCDAVTKGYDYFVLHHSDLGVTARITSQTGTWVDTLVSRLLQHNLACMSAVVPIKSPQGFTSSGLEMVAGDPFSLRRLTIKELDRLSPELITRNDVCKLFGVSEAAAGALLINSGLLIMDIRNRGGIWREKKWPGFNIVDTLAWNTKGIPDSRTVPEDWFHSRWMHDNAVSYACTKELVINHVGVQTFSNMGGWGTESSDLVRQQCSTEEYERS